MKKKMCFKRGMAGVLAMALSLSLMACGGDNSAATTTTNNEGTTQTDAAGEMAESAANANYVRIPIGDTAAIVHSSGEVFDTMFWGDYQYNVWREGKDINDKTTYKLDWDAFGEGMTYEELNGKQLSVVPGRMNGQRAYKMTTDEKEQLRKEFESRYDEATAAYLYGLYANISKMTFTFAKDDNGYVTSETVDGFYYVNHGKLYFYIGDKPTFDPAAGTILTFDVAVDGADLLLTRNGVTRALTPSDYTEQAALSKDNAYLDGYASAACQVYEDIANIHVYFDDLGDANTSSAIIYFTDGCHALDPVVTAFGSDGITVKWTRERRYGEDGLYYEKDVDRQISGIVIYNGARGLCLQANDRYYIYQNDSDGYKNMRLGSFVEETNVASLSEEEVETLIATQDTILADLAEAFAAEGINAKVDMLTGGISVDSSILFDVNDATLSEEGKAYLDKFFKVYTDVILSDKFANAVQSIVVEGHTDTTGSYDHNMELSEQRAQSVVTYCLEINPSVSESIVARGRSYDQPIYDAEGNVDMDASRRVEFGFALRVK